MIRGTQENIALLDRAVQSVNAAFNRRLQYPFVVFSGVRYPRQIPMYTLLRNFLLTRSHGESRDMLPKPEWIAWLANRTKSEIILAEVAFSEYYDTAPHSAESPDHVEHYDRAFRDRSR